MIRVFEAFAGIGSQRMALRNLGIEHEVVAISEINKYAIKSYANIHEDLLNNSIGEKSDEEMYQFLESRNVPLDEKTFECIARKLKGKELKMIYDACVLTNNLGDVTKIDTDKIPNHDLFTYSFPCQDISLAGSQKGFEKDSDTRSSALWSCLDIIEAKKPKYLMLENVKNLVSKKFINDFESWLQELEKLGYTNYYKVLNAREFGVPQKRERVIAISVLGTSDFEFPKGFELDKTLADVLEEEVDEKYYLDEESLKQLIYRNDIDFKNDEINKVGFIQKGENGTEHQSNTVYSNCGISPTLTASDFKNPTKLLIKNATKKGYLEAEEGDSVDVVYPSSKTRRGRVQKNIAHTIVSGDVKGVVVRVGGIFDTEKRKHQAGGIFDKDGISPTLDTAQGGWRQPSIVENNPLRIRKLTPLEYWRLMGMADEDFRKAEEVCSNTQLYKQAGNSIVVPKLEAVFKELFKNELQNMDNARLLISEEEL